MRPSRLSLLTAAAISSVAAEPVRIGKERQLFLDDHLIERTEHLVRRVQPARKHEAIPLIVPREDWEPEGYVVPSVLYDEEEKLFKRWADGYGIGVFSFTSRDGIRWERPARRRLAMFGDNLVQLHHALRKAGLLDRPETSTFHRDDAAFAGFLESMESGFSLYREERGLDHGPIWEGEYRAP